eukprot:2902595-Amphidinium_carterae.1
MTVLVRVSAGPQQETVPEDKTWETFEDSSDEDEPVAGALALDLSSSRTTQAGCSDSKMAITPSRLCQFKSL